jgi:hypothetical protein
MPPTIYLVKPRSMIYLDLMSRRNWTDHDWREEALMEIYNDRFMRAARLIWPWMVLNRQTERIWKELHENAMVCVMGHASASKTFTACAYYLMDWWKDPHNTSTVITAPTLISLRPRAWSDFKNLWKNSRMKMPGFLGDHRFTIRIEEHDDKHAIMGVAADAKDAVTKIQGLHSPRVRVIIDEADNPYSDSIWAAMANLSSSGSFKSVALANPFNRNSKFGQNCEPTEGWDSINIDTNHEWKSRTGFQVVRLDGFQSPNILSGKDEFPFLLTNDAISNFDINYGRSSPEWYAYVRGWFPENGSVQTIFDIPLSDKMCDHAMEFYAGTTKIAVCDPAFDGGDKCILGIGRAGFLYSNPQQACLEIYQYIIIKRTNIKIDVSEDFGHQIKKICEFEGVDPVNFAVDSSGTSLGLANYIRAIWSNKILCVSFAGNPSETKILAEDTRYPVDRFDRFVTELWWAAREWARVGALRVRNSPRDLRIQFSSRLYRSIGNDKIRMETKPEMKKRGLNSPDEADATVIAVELVRRRLSGKMQQTAITPELKGNSQTVKMKLPGIKMGSRNRIIEQSYDS